MRAENTVIVQEIINDIGIMEGDRVIPENAVILLGADGEEGFVRYLYAKMPAQTFVCNIEKFIPLSEYKYSGRVRNMSFAIHPAAHTKKTLPGEYFRLCHRDLITLARDTFACLYAPQTAIKPKTFLKKGWQKKFLEAFLQKFAEGKEVIFSPEDIEDPGNRAHLDVRYSEDTNKIHMRVVVDGLDSRAGGQDRSEKTRRSEIASRIEYKPRGRDT